MFFPLSPGKQLLLTYVLEVFNKVVHCIFQGGSGSKCIGITQISNLLSMFLLIAITNTEEIIHLNSIYMIFMNFLSQNLPKMKNSECWKYSGMKLTQPRRTLGPSKHKIQTVCTSKVECNISKHYALGKSTF